MACKSKLISVFLISLLISVLGWGLWLHCQEVYSSPLSIYKLSRQLNKEWFELGGSPYDVIMAQVVSQNLAQQENKVWFSLNRKGNPYGDGFFPKTKCVSLDENDHGKGISMSPHLHGTELDPDHGPIVMRSMFSDCWYIHFPPLNDWINYALYRVGVDNFSSRAIVYYLISLGHLLLLFFLLKRFFSLNASLSALLFYATSSSFIDWASMPLYIIWGEVFFTGFLLAIPRSVFLSYALGVAQVLTNIDFIAPQILIAGIAGIRGQKKYLSFMIMTALSLMVIAVIIYNRLTFMSYHAFVEHFISVYRQRYALTIPKLLNTFDSVYYYFRMSLCTTPLLLGLVGLSVGSYLFPVKTNTRKNLRYVLMLTLTLLSTFIVFTDTVVRHVWIYPQLFILPLIFLFAHCINYISQLKRMWMMILGIFFFALLAYDISSIRWFHYHETLLAKKVKTIQNHLKIIPSYALMADGNATPELTDFYKISHYDLITRNIPYENEEIVAWPFEFKPVKNEKFRVQVYYLNPFQATNLVVVASDNLVDEMGRCTISFIDRDYSKHSVGHLFSSQKELGGLKLKGANLFYRFSQLQSDLKLTQVIELECPLDREAEFYQVFSRDE